MLVHGKFGMDSPPTRRRKDSLFVIKTKSRITCFAICILKQHYELYPNSQKGETGRIELQKFTLGNIFILTIDILPVKATGMLVHLLRLDFN